MATKQKAPSPSRRATAARKAAAGVLAVQRRDIADARNLCRALVAELSFASAESEAIEAAVALDSEIDKRRQPALLRALSLAGRAAIMRDLAGATKTLIELERHAFDLTAADDADAEPMQPSAADSIAARIASLAAADASSGEL
jgi:hypothetical protein